MVRPRRRTLFVEGGGDHNPSLATECREAFSELFAKAGITRRPRVVVCGGRRSAYKQFCDALQQGDEDVWLLVDAEALAIYSDNPAPWAHVRDRPGDGWERPEGATDAHLHLMNVCMETWLLADRAALKAIFGPKFNEAKLPPEGASLETRDKDSIYRALQTATQDTPSGRYGKGSHSFKVLARVSPERLRALPWAARLLDALR